MSNTITSYFPSFKEINEEIKKLNYEWKNPKTYAAILVPIVSLYAQRTKLNSTDASIECQTISDFPEKSNTLRKKIVPINQAHTIGAAAQVVACFAIALLASSTIFSLLTAVAGYQFYYNVSHLGVEPMSYNPTEKKAVMEMTLPY